MGFKVCMICKKPLDSDNKESNCKFIHEFSNKREAILKIESLQKEVKYDRSYQFPMVKNGSKWLVAEIEPNDTLIDLESITGSII